MTSGLSFDAALEGLCEGLAQLGSEERMPLTVTTSPWCSSVPWPLMGPTGGCSEMRAAKLIVTIVNGAKPAELPIRRSERVLFAIDLNIPRSVLVRTDRIKA
jgi:hypothetical protein